MISKIELRFLIFIIFLIFGSLFCQIIEPAEFREDINKFMEGLKNEEQKETLKKTLENLKNTSDESTNIGNKLVKLLLTTDKENVDEEFDEMLEQMLGEYVKNQFANQILKAQDNLLKFQINPPALNDDQTTIEAADENTNKQEEIKEESNLNEEL